MFTGIITEIGTVVEILDRDDGARLTIEGPGTVAGLDVGDSVAVNGVCLTATDVHVPRFSVDVVRESLERSSLGSLDVDHAVNLERPLPAAGRYDGHIVQGHIDGVGTITDLNDEGDAVRVRCSLSHDLARYVVEKGSIAVDGTSLTITGVSERAEPDSWFEVVLIPHTLATTVFGSRVAGDDVNLEVDVLAKYVERLLGQRP